MVKLSICYIKNVGAEHAEDAEKWIFRVFGGIFEG